jgi:hypothetical protein
MTGWGWHYTPCPGGAKGGAGILAVIAAAVAAVMVARVLLWLIVVGAACLAVAVAVAAALWRRVNAYHPASAPPYHVEAVTARAIPQVAVTQAPAIENHYHGPQFHFHGRDGEEAAARIIRTALTGGEVTAMANGKDADVKLVGNDKDGKLDKILGAGSNPKNK